MIESLSFHRFLFTTSLYNASSLMNAIAPEGAIPSSLL